MGDPFIIKQHDRAPLWVVNLASGVDPVTGTGGAAVDLTTANSARFLMRAQNNTATLKVTATAAITNNTTGEVTYSWASGDTDTVGLYDVEVEIIWSDLRPETFPNAGYWTVDVRDDLDIP